MGQRCRMVWSFGGKGSDLGFWFETEPLQFDVQSFNLFFVLPSVHLGSIGVP